MIEIVLPDPPFFDNNDSKEHKNHKVFAKQPSSIDHELSDLDPLDESHFEEQLDLSRLDYELSPKSLQPTPTVNTTQQNPEPANQNPQSVPIFNPGQQIPQQNPEPANQNPQSVPIFNPGQQIPQQNPEPANQNRQSVPIFNPGQQLPQQNPKPANQNRQSVPTFNPGQQLPQQIPEYSNPQQMHGHRFSQQNPWQAPRYPQQMPQAMGHYPEGYQNGNQQPQQSYFPNRDPSFAYNPSINA
ncbi:unnamed protein product [Chironomus riparius]|uniref:Uncharacterized protein n=1 Tax=Chironomus riparius TaxID=315576 RepID=A0A9N9WYQ7_9DIPT|nr:unnamed protein product [Chironomus riparius]